MCRERDLATDVYSRIRHQRMQCLHVSRQALSELWAEVIGSLQAMEAIKYLIGVGELLTGYLLTYDALTMEFHKIKLPKDTHNCAVCGDHPTILEPIDYEQEVCEETAGRFDAPRTQE